ncbi:MAG: hypothetical protein ACLQNE_36230 [Thermoguttaceae bacterium]
MRVQEQLDRVLYDGKGNPVPVTKIETDVIGHQFRWTLWAGARRLITIPGRIEDVDEMLRCNQILLQALLR